MKRPWGPHVKLLELARSWLPRQPPVPLSQWFVVRFDEELVTLAARPPGREAWKQSFAWSSVIRVCFRDEGAFASEGLYVFTRERPESFVIALEAHGGHAFLDALGRRGLFPPKPWRSRRSPAMARFAAGRPCRKVCDMSEAEAAGKRWPGLLLPTARRHMSGEGR